MSLTIIIAIGAHLAGPATARVVQRADADGVVDADVHPPRPKPLAPATVHIIIKHLLPGVMPLVLAQTRPSRSVRRIIAESTLVVPRSRRHHAAASWGTILKSSIDIACSDQRATGGYVI